MSADRERQRRAAAGEPLPCEGCDGLGDHEYGPQGGGRERALECRTCGGTGDRVCEQCAKRPAVAETPHGAACRECDARLIAHDLRRSA